MKHAIIFLGLMLGFLYPVLSQSDVKFPELNITEFIKGSEADIGYWGDGKIYVIELWGTWCSPCIKNIPRLSAIQQKYKSKGLVVIGYSWENPEKVKELVNQLGDLINYTLVNDQEEKFMKILSEDLELVESFPASYVINEEGTLVWSGHPKNGLEMVVEQLFSK